MARGLLWVHFFCSLLMEAPLEVMNSLKQTEPRSLLVRNKTKCEPRPARMAEEEQEEEEGKGAKQSTRKALKSQ